MTIHQASHCACGLDIGSNTFSLVELQRQPSGVEVHRDTSVAVRLSEGLRPQGELKKSAVMRGLLTLEKLRDQFDLQNKSFKVVATAVLRMASNPEVFTEPAAEILGEEVEIITGEEEARLLGQGAVLALDHVSSPRVALDIGGQSTEIVQQDVAGTWHPLSLPMGVVGLSERFFPSRRIRPGQIKRMHEHVAAQFAAALPEPPRGSLIGVAGTATTLAMLELGEREWARDRVHGLQITEPAVASWLGKLARLSPEDRTLKHGIPPGRADVFPAGLVMLGVFMEVFHKKELTISANGLRVGVALQLLEALG